MGESRGLVVISVDGQMQRYRDPFPVTGEGVPSIRHINGAPYSLYRFSLLGVEGRLYGFIASLEPPTREECDRVAAELFGPKAAGLLELEHVSDAREAVSQPSDGGDVA